MNGGKAPTIADGGICPNESIVEMLDDDSWSFGTLAIEMVACYGMPVGESTFETCVWIGRFIEAYGGDHVKVYRKKKAECESVTMHLCKSSRAKDSNIRQAIIDRYEPTGGGKIPQIGTRAQPGPLYGIKSHLWSALAVGITALETRKPKGVEQC